MGHLLANLAVVVSILDLEVDLQERTHGQMARPCAKETGAAPKPPPPLRARRASNLKGGAGFPPARLTDNRHHLAAATARQPSGAVQLLQFELAADEPRQP